MKRYACSMVVFVDGGLPFGSLVVLHQFFYLFVWIVLSAGFSRRFRSRSSASDLDDAGRVGCKCRMRPAEIMRPLSLFTAFLTVFLALSTVRISPALAASSQASA